MGLSRRLLLAAGAGLAATAAARAQDAGRRVLRLQTRTIEVDGKPASRYAVYQPDGTWGLTLNEGDRFVVRLENGLSVPSGLHWHGLNPPWPQDGVPFLSGPPVAPGSFADYDFPALPAGTRWMHSHMGLQEQDLLAAPLIVREKSAIASGLPEIVAMFEDFSWRAPTQILADLRKPRPMAAMPAAGGMAHQHMDLNDVTYDAFLANHRTLADPPVFDVERGGEVRLRLINGAASTNFWIDLGALEGTLIAVDGNPVQPVRGRLFPLAIAQRADIVVRVPSDGAALPVLARGEGQRLQAGIVLRPRGAAVAKLSTMGEQATPALGLVEEMALRATQPLAARPVDQSVPIDLTGAMTGYEWGVGVHGMQALPVTVDKGQRVELVMRNTTMMAHPMHLHGHSFQVVGVDDRRFPGAMRDCVLVPPMTTVRVAFDADNPGLWAYHCHNLYHMAAGMFATVAYRGFS